MFSLLKDLEKARSEVEALQREKQVLSEWCFAHCTLDSRGAGRSETRRVTSMWTRMLCAMIDTRLQTFSSSTLYHIHRETQAPDAERSAQARLWVPRRTQAATCQPSALCIHQGRHTTRYLVRTAGSPRNRRRRCLGTVLGLQVGHFCQRHRHVVMGTSMRGCRGTGRHQSIRLC